MPSQTLIRQPAAIRLSARRTTRVLNQLQQAGRDLTVSLTGDSAAHWMVEGHLVGLWAGSLEFDASVGGSAGAPPEGVTCTARFALANERYGFESEVHAVRKEGERLHLVLSRPERAWMCQRRRFWRATLRESTAITLTTSDPAMSVNGAVLNVSVDGLGCRVGRERAERFCVGDTVEARFMLDGDEQALSLRAQVRGKAAAGSADQMILRLQFASASLTEEDRGRIERAIHAIPEPT